MTKVQTLVRKGCDAALLACLEMTKIARFANVYGVKMRKSALHHAIEPGIEASRQLGSTNTNRGLRLCMGM